MHSRSKRGITGSTNSSQQQYHYQQHQYHLQQAVYHNQQSLAGGESIFGSVDNDHEPSPVYYTNDIKYHRFTDQVEQQQQLLAPSVYMPAPTPVPALAPVPHGSPPRTHNDGGDEHDNDDYDDYQDDAAWDGRVDPSISQQHENQQHLHQPHQPLHPKPANQTSPLRRSVENQRNHTNKNDGAGSSSSSSSSHNHRSNSGVDEYDDDDAGSKNAIQLTIDIQKHSQAPQDTPRRGEVTTLLTEGRGISKAYLLRKLSHIGRGSSATVYKTFHCGRFQVVAEKVIECSSETRKSDLIRELASLRTLLDCDDSRKQYIVGLLDVIGTSDQEKSQSFPNVSVCLEFMHASLQDVVDSGGCTEEIVISGMARQMLLGLSFIHERRFLHRDFKPGNILVNSKGMVKISDLGLCIDLPKGNSLAESFTGTYHYMSPERIEGGRYSYSSDVWGLGMTILACAMGCYPYNAERGYWALLAAIKDEPVPTPDPSRFSPECRDFIALATKKVPDERSTAADLLQHIFINKHWKEEENATVSSPRSNQYMPGSSVRDSGENNVKLDAMKTSNEWIRTSINSLSRRPVKLEKASNNINNSSNRKKIGGDLRPTKSAHDKPRKEVDRRYSAGASASTKDQLAGNSVMLTARGKLMVPDVDGVPSEDTELRIVLKAFKKYLQHMWKQESISTGHGKQTQDGKEVTIDPLSAVTPSSLGALALQINHPPAEVRKLFLSLIKSLQAAPAGCRAARTPACGRSPR